MSHYETLGVASDASQEQVKAAYRKMAAKTHPDREGGDVGEFQKVQRAYAVLSNPVAKAKYDESGQDDAPMDERAAARDRLADMLKGAIENTDNPAENDLIAMMQVVIRKTQQGLEARIRETEGAIEKRQKVAKRLRRRKGENFLVAAIQRDIKNHERSILQLRQGIKDGDVMLEELEGFEFEVEVTQPRYDAGIAGFSFKRTR